MLLNPIANTLRSRYFSIKSNQIFPIGDYDYTVNQGNKEDFLRGTFSYHLYPFPYIEISTHLNYTLFLDIGNCNILFAEKSYQGYVFGINHNSGNSSFKIRIEESLVIGNTEPIDFISFHIPNFIDNEGFATKSKRGVQHGTLILSDDNYFLRIDKLFKYDKIVQELNYSPGTSITHLGILHRKDRNKIFWTEIDKIQLILNLFLSFVKGSKVSAIIFVGYRINTFAKIRLLKRPILLIKSIIMEIRKGNRILESIKSIFSKEEIQWKQWNFVRNFQIYKWIPSFFRHDISEDLIQLYPKFVKTLENPDWNGGFKLTLDIYFQTNRKEAEFITLINLNQVVFEAISWLKFVEIDRIYTDTDYDNPRLHNAASKLNNLLGWLNIPDVIPPTLTNLTNFAATKTFTTASKTITFIRNKYVHPKDISLLASFDIKMMEEAWRLGCHYIDLILLRILDHDGSYFNRISRTKEKVPW